MNEVTSPDGFRGSRIDVKDAAYRLGVSPSWIYDHKRRDDLPFRVLQPVPGKYYFDSADIDDYIASRWHNPGAGKNPRQGRW